MKQEPTLTYDEHVSEAGMDIKIKGEVYNKPIFEKGGINYHTEINLLNINTGENLGRFRYSDENDLDTLTQIVKAYKDNIINFLPKN